MCIRDRANGSEMVVLALLINKLDEIWILTSFEKGSLGSSSFIGFTLGGLFAGYISDRKGRRPAYLIGAVLVLIFSVASSFSQSFFWFIILRIMCGFGIGIAVPALLALATELTPVDYRSMVLNYVWASYPVGAAFVILMTKYFIDTEYGWRIILLFASLPCLLILTFSHYIPESPRFYMSRGKYEKAFEELDKIIKYAKMEDTICIGEQDKQNLIDESEHHQLNKKEANYQILVSPEYRRLTLLVCIIYFIVSLNYYGATYILPQIFKEEYEKDKENGGDVYISLLVSCFFEAPSCFLAGYLANHRFLYRVKTMILGSVSYTHLTLPTSDLV